MTRIKFLGLAVVAVLATVGVLATSASAAVPTWYECAKTAKNGENKYTGQWTDKLCANKASVMEVEEGKTNKYELKEGIGKGKKIKSKASLTGGAVAMGFIVKSPQGTFPITCASEKGEATPGLPNLEKAVDLTFKKCTFTGEKCTTAGGKGVEIKGEGELNYVEEGNKVGLEVKNPLGEEQPIAVLECGKGGEYVKAEMVGALIGVQEGDINTVAKESTLTYLAQEQYGVHVFETHEYHPSVNIVGFSPEGEEATACFAKAPKTMEEEEVQSECQKAHPPHLMLGTYCGSFVEGVLGGPCTPPTYTGLSAFKEASINKVTNLPLVLSEKGEALMLKA